MRFPATPWRVLTAHAACTLVFAAGTAQAKDDYPARPIRLVIPYAAGGLSDAVVRTAADELEKRHGMKIVVENRTGGNTVPAALAVTKAAPDGYTIGWFSSSTFTTVPVLNPGVPFKVSDFQPVFMAYRGPIVLAVANHVPARDPVQFIAQARQQSPARALVGATAKGGAGHLMAAALGHEAKVDVELVAYRGGPPMVLELLSGQLPAAIDILDTFLPQHRAGKLRIISHTGSQRLAVLPDVPTFAEAGFPNVKGQFWHGLFAPASTPPEVVNLLSERFNEVMKSPAVTARLSPDLEVVPNTPADFAAHLARDRAYWESVIRLTAIKLD